MPDLLYLALVAAFFGITGLMIWGLDRLGKRSEI
jgi:hypothetical protein